MRASVRMCDHARAFSTRPRGTDLAETVSAAAESAEHVEIDFSGVLAVSYSFIDQFVRDLDDHSCTDWSFSFVCMAPAVERVVRRNCSNRGFQPELLCAG